MWCYIYLLWLFYIDVLINCINVVYSLLLAEVIVIELLYIPSHL